MPESPGSIPVRKQCLVLFLVMEKDTDTLIQAAKDLKKTPPKGWSWDHRETSLATQAVSFWSTQWDSTHLDTKAWYL